MEREEPRQRLSPSTAAADTTPGRFLISSGAAAPSQADKGGEALPREDDTQSWRLHLTPSLSEDQPLPFLLSPLSL
ncbi:hypothetical protein EYF80_036325 [Liparis tanakae]|uniref:Uncharacterized protein n=1 Tax=Liparis tanakae TaxID=230148 RepID=A0A4Z2GKX2_9TELE|nr:hypothetical protein EYF80_036325 [Liparis tanakae]